MKDSHLAQLRAQLIADAAKQVPAKRSLFGRPKVSDAGVNPPAPVRAEPDQLQLFDEPRAPRGEVVSLPPLPIEPRRRSTFGQRRTSGEDSSPLLLVPPMALDAQSGEKLQRRLSSWLAVDPSNNGTSYYLQVFEGAPKGASDLHTAAEAAETPYHPEDVQDRSLAEDLAMAMAAIKEVAASSDAPVVTLASSDRERKAGEVLARLHKMLMAEDLALSQRLTTVAKPGEQDSQAA